jgi:glycosyltransferase involved in cell wall biosynthesis
MYLLETGDLEVLQGKGLGFCKQRARWRLGVAVARKVKAGALFFSVLDDVAMAAVTAPPSGLAVSGLLFRPSIHYPEFRRGWHGRLRQAAKTIILKRVLERCDLKTLFSFDPYFVSFARTNLRAGHKVQFLPEPFDPPAEAAEGAGAVGQRLRFLFYGAMQRRKGVIPLLEALPLLSADEKLGAEFVFCGDGPMVAEIERRVPLLKAAGVSVRLEGRFLAADELTAEIRAADVILAPYLDHVGSSGVLVAAAAWGKPVLSQAKGLLGREIVRYGLGEAVDTHSAAAIAEAIGRLLRQARQTGGTPRHSSSAFLAQHGEEKFVRTLLEWT